MLRSLFMPGDAICCSLISGWNLYSKTGTMGKWIDGSECPYASHMKTGETFLFRIIQPPINLEALTAVTASGMPQRFLWPVDVAEGSGSTPTSMLVFREPPETGLTSLADWIAQRSITESQEDAQTAVRFIRQLLLDADCFYRCGFAYSGWDANRIYLKKDGSGFLYDFCAHTDRIRACKAYPSDAAARIGCDPVLPHYGSDLDYFALCSLLFQVLVGLRPYQGRLMDGIGNQTAVEQAAWSETYRENCVFLFDPDDRRNSIGTFAHEEQFVRRWMQLPDDVRNTFSFIFSGKQFRQVHPTPSPALLMQSCALFRGDG